MKNFEKYGCILFLVAIALILVLFELISEKFGDGIGGLFLFSIFLIIFVYSIQKDESTQKKALYTIIWIIMLLFVFWGIPKLLLNLFGDSVFKLYLTMLYFILIISFVWAVSVYKRR